MQNTLDIPEKRKKKFKLQLTYEREVYIKTPGSLNLLERELVENGINIDASEILKTIPIYILNFTENQRLVFKAYYLRQMSISDIRSEFNFKCINDVERPLKSATARYIKMIKAGYDIV